MYSSKYVSRPDNHYFEKRINEGQSLQDLFDDIDWQAKCYIHDANRPIKVRVGREYNYILKGYILFDNWFSTADEFRDFEDVTYAYRRLNEKRCVDGGVLIRRNGSYVTREEFSRIIYDSCNERGKYALVQQYDNLWNILDVNTGLKLSEKGITVDAIYYNNYSFPNIPIFIVAKGDFERLSYDEWSGWHSNPIYGIKYNYYKIGKGFISKEWFDFVEPFPYDQDFGRSPKLGLYAIVHKDSKVNFIDMNGKLLSQRWFDNAIVWARGEGIAGIQKPNVGPDIPDYFTLTGYENDEWLYNPKKYESFKLLPNGQFIQIR